MTPIVSRDDVRLSTLIGVAMRTIENLALVYDRCPQELLAEELYRVQKQILANGEEGYANKLATDYPLLNEAIS